MYCWDGDVHTCEINSHCSTHWHREPGNSVERKLYKWQATFGG